MLVLAISYFLVTETTAFYAQSDQTAFGPLLKALLLDGSVFALSLMKPRGGAHGFVQKAMVGLIYAYTVWAVSGGVWTTASQLRREYETDQKAVSELEAEIVKATAHTDRYLAENRIRLGTRVKKSTTELRTKLETVRERVVKAPNADAVLNTLATLIVFRILVMISNLFILAELKRRYRAGPKHY